MKCIVGMGLPPEGQRDHSIHQPHSCVLWAKKEGGLGKLGVEGMPNSALGRYGGMSLDMACIQEERGHKVTEVSGGHSWDRGRRRRGLGCMRG